MEEKRVSSSIHIIEKRLRIKAFIVAIAWLLMLVILAIILSYFNDETNSVVVEWISLRLDIFFVILLALGWGCIGHYFWKKPWHHLEEVTNAIESIYERDGRGVTLSEPLYKIENMLNQIKLTVSTTERSITQAEEKKNDLVMCLAHDIRTPLTTVIGYLNLLREATDIPEPQRQKYTDIALEKSERMDVLINELFDLTRYTSRTLTINKTNIDLCCLLSQISDEFYPILSENDNTVTLTGSKSLMICIDSEKIVRAFGNKLRNASIYSDRGSEIEISVEKESDDAVVVFKNTGNTISDEELITMFDKFKRLDKARGSNTGGTGLGLSIAKEIIELHGGTIKAESADRTITIIVKIPLTM